MAELDEYLKRQIKRPTTLISFAFEIPGRKPDKKNRNTFIYNYGDITPRAK